MSKPRHRNNSGESLIAVVIAMVVAALLIPGFLLLLRNSYRLATIEPDHDEGLLARTELAELFGSVDPIGSCASPVGGTDAAYRDRCFRETRRAGASLIAPPPLPATRLDPADPNTEYAACWLTSQEGGTRQRKCIVLEGDSDRMECADTPTGPCLKVLSEFDEADGEPVLVDRHGGGLLLVRSWNEDTSTAAGVPFLPHEWEDTPTDRLIYTDTEWWCLRWRLPSSDGSGGVTPWEGDCPAPADPCERIPNDPSTPEREEWNPAWSVATETWTASNQCQPDAPALPDPARYAVADPDVNGDGIIDGPPDTIGTRITDIELLVCVASDRPERLQGAAHCAVDRMRFTVADAFGSLPPAPRLEVIPAVAANGLTVEEGSGMPFNLQLGLEPSALVTVTVTAPPGLTLNAPSGVSLTTAMLTLTFTPGNWNEPQEVTVTVDPDDIKEDEQHFTVTLTATSTGDDYSGLQPTEVQVTVPPSDYPALVVAPGSVTVAENGTAAFVVRLEAPPLFLVTVTVTSDDTAVASVDSSSLTFTTTDWETSQTVTVTGTDDADISDEATSVTLDPSSVDGDYNILEDAAVEVTVTDDDEPALVLSANTVTVDENGTASLDVSLATLPSGPVTVTVASADPTAATVAPASLTFTTSNWDTGQSVTISGAADDTDYDNETITVTLTADSNYDNLTASVAVAVTDDDSPFAEAEARGYTCARDKLTDLLNDSYYINAYGESWYASEYQSQVTWVREQSGCAIPHTLPLGEDDPDSLPNPQDKQALSDAIDALAVAVGLPQSLIDAAEGG